MTSRGRTLQIVARVLGITLAAAALFADLVRGNAFTFGFLQAVALLLGVTLVICSAGHNISAVWRGMAIVLLNILVLLVVLDLAAWVTLNNLSRGRYAGGIRNAWYDSQPWAPEYRREFSAVNDEQRFTPYLLWTGKPASGRYVNVDAAGRRSTTGPRCDRGTWRVAVLGGSTVWGVGAPDSLTIPSYLGRALSLQSSRPVCVVNLGERAYVSTQEVIRLALELQRGRIPDAVVVYSGINDVINAWRYRDPGTHSAVDRVERRLKGEPGWTAWLRSWHATRLLQALAERRSEANPAAGSATATDSMSRAVADIWRANCGMISALGVRYGFVTACFLQPAMAVGRKPFTPQEQASLTLMREGEQDLFAATYARIRSQPPADVHFKDLSDAFDSVTAQLYIDWYHVAPPANAIVAQRMANELAALPGFPARSVSRRL